MRSTEQERRRTSRAEELYDEIIQLVATFEAEYEPPTPEQAVWHARMDLYVHTRLAQLRKRAQLRKLDGEKTGSEDRSAPASSRDRAGIEVAANEPLSAAHQDDKKLKWCALWKRAAALIAEFEVEHATSDSAWASRVAEDMRSKVAAMQDDLQGTLSETSSVFAYTPPAVTN